MRNQTPLAPVGPVSDTTVYLPLNDFGPPGRACCETDEADANEATVIENLLSGQNSHPLRVVAFPRDVTEDIARAALSKAQSEHRPIAKATLQSGH